MEAEPSLITKIFIQRDYTYGTGVRFREDVPQELSGKIEPSVYKETLEHVNEIFEKAEAMSCRTITEGCFSCITGYTLHYCFKTYYERCVEEVARYLQQQNDSVYLNKGITFGDPMDRGLRCMEVVIARTPRETNM
ncbi:golgin subfamily A member 7-like [Halichondria panicea]|uniref:golgin subfamily A member 7-like n=1 Tax=Halichondria panicea TaxID=6063 RepID=UPI00312BAC54